MENFKSIKSCVDELSLTKSKVESVLRKEQNHTKGYQIFFKDALPHEVQKLDLVKMGNNYQNKRKKTTNWVIKDITIILDTLTGSLYVSPNKSKVATGMFDLTCYKSLYRYFDNPKLYKNRYQLVSIKNKQFPNARVKFCELLETLEEGNQQPSHVEIHGRFNDYFRTFLPGDAGEYE